MNENDVKSIISTNFGSTCRVQQQRSHMTAVVISLRKIGKNCSRTQVVSIVIVRSAESNCGGSKCNGFEPPFGEGDENHKME